MSKLLAQNDAIQLWQGGREAWNKWVHANNDYSISFEGIDFTQYRGNDKKEISFAGFHFPSANISFSSAIFGDGDVDFTDAKFFGRFTNEVSFANSQFGDGDIFFSNAHFCGPNVSFENVTFGDGVVVFYKAKFDSWNVSFRKANFGNAKFSLERATMVGGFFHLDEIKFEKGHVLINEASFESIPPKNENSPYQPLQIHFEKSYFKNVNLSLNRSQFCKSKLLLNDIVINNGAFTLNAVRLTDSYLNLTSANLGNSDVSLAFSIFECSLVNFNDCQFGEGSKSFKAVEFDKVFFQGVNFGVGDVVFERSKFQSGEIDFSHLKLLNGSLDFNGAKFGKGKLNLNYAYFQNSNLYIRDISTEKTSVSFQNSICSGRFEISLNEGSHLNGLNLNGSIIEGAVQFRHLIVDSVIRITSTTFTHPISLHNVRYTLNRRSTKSGLKIANQKDIASLTRLKEIAISNKHHEVALQALADESRARRWSQMGKLFSIADMLYSWLSDYGRRISRPVICWFFSVFVFFLGYMGLYFTAGEKSLRIHDSLWLFLLSVSNSIPFLSTSREARTFVLDTYMSSTKLPDSSVAIDTIYSSSAFYLLMTLQGIISTVLIFLICLGLRNKFRL